MTSRTTDRKGKSKELKSLTNELQNEIAAFTLPNSLPCSEIEFPVAPRRRPRANWDEILEESEEKYQEIEEWQTSKRPPESAEMAKRPLPIDIITIDGGEDAQKENISPSCASPSPSNTLFLPIVFFKGTECNYLKEKVFVHLQPALEETLQKAQIWEALKQQKCFFNGIDHIAQLLWNNNPKYPDRKEHNLHIFNMPWVRELLKTYPRPYYPKSWLWPEDYAATVIQKTVRQYFVQREDEVQEMRNFWRKLEVERAIPEIQGNPLLSKKFAASQN